MAVPTGAAEAVSVEDLLIGRRIGLFEPGQQRGAEVEADLGVGVVNLQQAPLTIDDARRGIGGIAFGRDALISVVEWRGRVLGFELFKPRILPRWLVKMPVNTQITLGHRRLPACVFTCSPVVVYISYRASQSH